MRIFRVPGAATVALQLLIAAAAGACGSPGTDVGGDASVESDVPDAAPTVDELLDPERFKDAAKCPDCEVLHSARLHLPETAVVAASAKMHGPGDRFFVITVKESGEVVEEKTLLENERAAARAKYGKLQPGLHHWLASAADADRAWVWIWSDVPRDDARREDLLKDEALAKAHAEKQQKALDAALSPIREWLAKNAADAELGDEGGPMLRAKLTPPQVRALESLPQVITLGTDSYPGTALSAPWATNSQWAPTIRLAEAHAISRGSGRRVCIKEESRPDLTTNLVLAGTAAPGAGSVTSSHTRGMAGIIRNTDVSVAPWRSVAPEANVWIANWAGYAGGPGGVTQWCRTLTARIVNYSYTVAPPSAAGYAPTATDWLHDWLARNSPYTIVVASAGTIGSYDYVHNRGYNGLVVGSVLDQNTADRSDDLADPNASWRNPVTAHNDHELPHVVAPGNGASVAGVEVSGSSAATAMVSGTAALLSNSSLSGWPEAMRAVIIATATGRADQGLINALSGAGDRRIGAGEIDAYQAANLGQQAFEGTLAVKAKGHTMLSLADASPYFGADGYLTWDKWKAHADFSGRVRVVIAWAATADCPGGTGSPCTSETLNADLDLHLYKKTGDATWTPTGELTCASSTWDSAWELCDIPVVAGDDYLIAVKKFSMTGTSLNLAVAWYLYQQPSGSPCTFGTECASGSCNSGKCTCTGDANCPDRYCDVSGMCANRFANGSACTRVEQCLSGNCVDGVCCDTSCGGTCQACTAAKKGSGANGVCGSIGDGLDSDGQCAATYPQNCTAGSVTRAQVCNGAAACRSNGTYSCSGYQCLDTTQCRTTCSSDTQCMSTHYCSGSSCVAKTANGLACTAANQCSSGNCVDGVCCDTGCGGTCQACTAAKKGSGTDGTCGPIADGTNPDIECTAESCTAGVLTHHWVCNGASACRSNGSTSCAGYACITSPASCKSSCTTSSDCESTHYCAGTACVPKKTNGATCGGAGECTSGFCVDGVCCNAGCGAACQACNVAGSVGTCTATDETGCAPICGNGWRNEAEECDDGLGTSTSARRSCSSTCQVQDLLAVPSSTDLSKTPERYLGTGRHPIGVISTGYATAYVEDAGSIAKVGLAIFDSKGVALDPSKVVAASAPFDANPVVAGLPDGNYAVAYTDFGGDGDALGIALRKVNLTTGPTGTVSYANGTTNFSQYDADMIWTGTELVVAWVDTSNGSTGPDVRFRRFTSSLTPIAAEETLANTGASEADVALTTFGTGWAAAWRSAFAGMETVYVRAAGKTWTAATTMPGPTQVKPALVQLDATHLLLVFVEHGWDSTAGTLTPSQLRGAIVDTTTTGGALTSAPIDSSTTSMTTPALVKVGTRFYLAWRNDAVSGSSAGDELWLKEILWNSTTAAPDFTATEITLPRWSAHVAGDQRAPAFAAGAVMSGPALIAAWEDYGTSLGPPRTAVVSELAPTPLLRMP